MFKVVLVGCGNLGSRHLQGIKKTRRNIDITVCEPYENARNIALERYNQVDYNPLVSELCVLDDYHQLKGYYDLVIVATNSVNRYEIASWIIEHLNIRYMVLEKVVFQSISEFDLFERKIKERNVKVWVNCARRMYPYYQNLRPQLENEHSIDMIVNGGNWGMGSNTIHMLDLYYYFTGFSQYKFDNSRLEKHIQNSKRRGYSEFYGELKYITDRGNILIKCDHGDEPLEIRIITEEAEILVIESNGIVRYQSDLTNLVIEQLIDKGECYLSTYEESSFIHKAVLESFLDHINRFSDEEEYRCPIT